MGKLNSTDYQILEMIKKNLKISRTDLSKEMELTPAAISKVIKKLILHDLIVEKNVLFFNRWKTENKIRDKSGL